MHATRTILEALIADADRTSGPARRPVERRSATPVLRQTPLHLEDFTVPFPT